MGTSVNQRSPDTPNWRIVQRAYEDPSYPMDRALREIWRAAGNQPEGDLTAQLAQPVIGAFADLATNTASPLDASREIGQFVAESKAASLAADIAARAAIQSAGKEDAGQFFVARLFAEATNYLVSRDLPGHVTPEARLGSVAEARSFKRQIMDLTAQAVARIPPPASFGGDEWSSFVNTVVGEIQQRRR